MFPPVHPEYITYDLHKCEWVSRVNPSVVRVILLCGKIFYAVRSTKLGFIPPKMILGV